MADVIERLDNIEQAQAATNERLGAVEGELGTVKGKLGEIKARLDQHDRRFDHIDERFEKVDQRFDSLDSEVQKLRILEEANSDRINVIAEVQSQHGEKLEELVKAVVPLKDFVMRVVGEHEHRITALEKRGAADRGL